MKNRGTILEKWDIDFSCDLLDIFKEEPVVLRGCFDFSLKSIGGSMKKFGMIRSRLPENCNSGTMAMVQCEKFYGGGSRDIMDDIRKYNEYDCKVLWEILTYLRKNHI